MNEQITALLAAQAALTEAQAKAKQAAKDLAFHTRKVERENAALAAAEKAFAEAQAKLNPGNLPAKGK